MIETGIKDLFQICWTVHGYSAQFLVPCLICATPGSIKVPATYFPIQLPFGMFGVNLRKAYFDHHRSPSILRQIEFGNNIFSMRGCTGMQRAILIQLYEFKGNADRHIEIKFVPAWIVFWSTTHLSSPDTSFKIASG